MVIYKSLLNPIKSQLNIGSLTLHGPVEGRGVRLIGQRHIAAQRQQELNHLRGAEFGCLVYTLW